MYKRQVFAEFLGLASAQHHIFALVLHIDFVDESVSYTHLDVYKRQRWYRKDSAILAQSTIFLHYLLGIVKQLDVGFRSCLLSVDNNPCLLYTSRCV